MEKQTVQFLLCFLIQFAVFSSAKGDEGEANSACGPNAQYIIDPAGAICEKTCQNPELVCAESPLGWEGCKCDDGFLRNSNGDCVNSLDEECLAGNNQCGENEVMADQEANCKNCEASCRVQAGSCGEICQGGCYCQAGHFRNNRGVCILEDQCNDIALNNDVYTEEVGEDEGEEEEEVDDIIASDDAEIIQLMKYLIELLSDQLNEEE